MKKYFFSLFLILFIGVSVIGQVQVVELTTEHKVNPSGISVSQPRLSWKLTSTERNSSQVAFQIRVATSPNFEANTLVWDSKKIVSNISILQSYQGLALQSKQTYYWQVKVWDNKNRESNYSKTALWEMALLSHSEWIAKWIEPEIQPLPETDISPAFMLRKTFTLKDKVASARAYVTSHGYYELSLNGKKVGTEQLTPGWTAYQKRLQYQTYNVTNMLNNGANAVGAFLGEGWYRSHIGWKRSKKPLHGEKLGFLCQIFVQYTNGKTEWIITDGSWKYTSDGPIVMNEIYDGESYDATREIKDWNKSNFNDSTWKNVIEASFDNSVLIATDGAKVEKIQELKPKKIFRTPKGLLVADMGQNMVGWVRLNVKGKRGTTITIRHAEVLDKDGNFYTDNLRKAKATMTYTLKGEGVEVYEPRFTFFGFRYISIEGIDLKSENITGIVVHSNMEPTGTFECSDALINQLQHNIQWGQKGNFVDVPTDCPQRDERLGWTGDAQAFIRTAAYNFDVAPFFTKWLKDVAADQRKDGSVPNVVPDVLNPLNSPTAGNSAGWGDVAVIAPWTIYLTYGDTQLLQNQYPSMKAWVDYTHKKIGDSYISQKAEGFGDWLFYVPDSISKKAGFNDGFTDKRYINTAFFAYATSLLRDAAVALNKEEDAKSYNQLFENIKTAFNKEYTDDEGKIKPIEGKRNDSQTAYVLALMFDLLPPTKQAKAAGYLVADIKSRGNHLSTGFLGTPYLCHVLSSYGYTDVAYDLLLQKTYPSWLFPVTMGATTIWERWDGQKPDGTFQSVGMNSFNHYAYGAVGDWMYRVVAGIEIDPSQPGYKHFFIKPQPTTKLTYAKSSLNSPYGEIESGWKIKDGLIKLNIKIPVNTSATITLPQATKSVTESGKPLNVSGFKTIKESTKGLVIEVGAGDYVFEYKWK